MAGWVACELVVVGVGEVDGGVGFDCEVPSGCVAAVEVMEFAEQGAGGEVGVAAFFPWCDVVGVAVLRFSFAFRVSAASVA